MAAHNIALPQIWADGSKINIISLLFFSSRWTDLQLAFAVTIKIRSFNKQHHLADIASNAQPAAMPPLVAIANRNFRYICSMTDLNIIKQILTQLKPELTAKYNVSSIGLFGSVVRDDFSPSSDVDIIVDFSKPIGIEFVDLADFIEKKLNKNVDLVSKNGVKQKYYRSIESEIIYV